MKRKTRTKSGKMELSSDDDGFSVDKNLDMTEEQRQTQAVLEGLRSKQKVLSKMRLD